MGSLNWRGVYRRQSRVIFFVALQLSKAVGDCRRCMKVLSKCEPGSRDSPVDSLEQCCPNFCSWRNPFKLSLSYPGEKVDIRERSSVTNELYLFVRAGCISAYS